MGERQVFIWLVVMAVLVVAMTTLGGAVRLTDSGLSITEWRPLLGIFPPLTQQAWAEAFSKYQLIPQYEAGIAMSLAEFKVIYWWEWSHRLLGRLVGVVFAVPFLFFLWRGFLSRRDISHYAGIFILGGMQGVIGWYMVRSGLSERLSVAPLRLALHLGLAVVIYGWLLCLIFERFRRFEINWQKAGLVGLVFVQIILGAMVSGSDGGLIYNDFLWGEGSPLGANLAPSLDNAPLWQLIHRLNGWLLFGCTAAYFWSSGGDRGALLLLALIFFQIILGLLTLFSAVFLPLALFHQLVGILCFSAALWLLTGKAK